MKSTCLEGESLTLKGLEVLQIFLVENICFQYQTERSPRFYNSFLVLKYMHTMI